MRIDWTSSQSCWARLTGAPALTGGTSDPCGTDHPGNTAHSLEAVERARNTHATDIALSPLISHFLQRFGRSAHACMRVPSLPISLIHHTRSQYADSAETATNSHHSRAVQCLSTGQHIYVAPHSAEMPIEPKVCVR